MAVQIQGFNHARSRARVPGDTEAGREEEAQLMEGAMNSTLVLLELYICGIPAQRPQ